MAECRNASGAITSQFFAMGETISGSNYLYSKTFDGSVRELTSTTGVLAAQYIYDPYGRATRIQGSLMSDFLYAGYYFHSPSGLSLTLNRAYSANVGRWISRDPIAEQDGPNLYEYAANSPTVYYDPSGLQVALQPPTSPVQIAWDIFLIAVYLGTRDSGSNPGGGTAGSGAGGPSGGNPSPKCDQPCTPPRTKNWTTLQCEDWCYFNCKPGQRDNCKIACRDYFRPGRPGPKPGPIPGVPKPGPDPSPGYHPGNPWF